jgi:Uncharacterized protein conserved in bacteria
MNYKPPARCAVCGEELNVTRLACPKCGSEISGSFSACRYCALDDRLGLFLETFLKCRGNIKEIEKRLSVSYPTVKNMQDELLKTLFPGETEKDGPTASEILDRLETGEITAAEAAELLRQTR